MCRPIDLQQELRDASWEVLKVLRFQCMAFMLFLQSQQQLHQGLPALKVRCA